jgi:hypothetical protein
VWFPAPYTLRLRVPTQRVRVLRRKQTEHFAPDSFTSRAQRETWVRIQAAERGSFSRPAGGTLSLSLVRLRAVGCYLTAGPGASGFGR